MEELKMQELETEFSRELEDLKSEVGKDYNNVKQCEKKVYRGVELDPHKEYNVCNDPLTKTMGTKTFEGHKETYYTSNPKARPHFDIHKTAHPVPGVHIAKGDGTVRDKDGYIVLACNGLNFKHVVMTSLGPGKVYDRGGMKEKTHIDIFTNR